MGEEIYQRLAKHLDRLPGGFAPSKTGADIRLLRYLFTPEEADLATYLNLNSEEAVDIASRVKMPLDKTRRRLEEMAEKGLILSVQQKDGQKRYQAAPWAVGIYEFQVNRFSDDFLKAVNEYWDTEESRPGPKTIPQMRTIPVGKSIDTRVEALPYEQVEELVNANDRFGVAPCICRTRKRKMGKGCDAPLETCLLFGDFADFYVRTGRGRSITKSDVKELLAKANEANLVLNPTNSQFVSAICCCCGCCCGILEGLKYSPKPSKVVASSFIAEYEAGNCVGCLKCTERCQMQAIVADGDLVKLDTDRCIGCGLCVSTCPSGALKLKRKPEATQSRTPTDLFETWRTIAKVRAAHSQLR